MKAYLITTAALFGLITVAHLLRIAMEGQHLATDPIFLLLTLASAALAVWAVYLLRHASR